MRVRSPNNLGRTVQTDPASLHCASAIAEQKKCWLKSLTGFKLRANGHNNFQHYPQHILGDPGADSGDEGKSKRAEKYDTKKSKERREEPLGTMANQTSSNGRRRSGF